MADPAEFAGRVALVTGAAGQGIGQAVARRLAAGGARVVVTDIHPGPTRSWTPSPRRWVLCGSWSTTRR